MNWIDYNLGHTLFRSNAERRSVWLFAFYESACWLNPLGMTNYSHGIHPMEESGRKVQIPFGMNQT
ncbi:MAG: hypothetical protein WD361_07440, partial [Gracilimonas sp.]